MHVYPYGQGGDRHHLIGLHAHSGLVAHARDSSSPGRFQVNFPPHLIFVLAAVAALLSLGGAALWVLAKSSSLLPLPKWIIWSIVVAVVAAASAWFVFILPVYWD